MSEDVISSHVQKYYALLKSGLSGKLSLFSDTYRRMKPLLHRELDTNIIDVDVLNYAATRLPPNTFAATKIYLAQNRQDFINLGLPISEWNRVNSPNRRRVIFQSPDAAEVALLVNSDSDIDDIVNNLLAYQIEHQKISRLRPGDKPAMIFNTNTDYKNFLSIFGSTAEDYFLSCVDTFDPEIVLIDYQTVKYTANAHQWWQETASRSFIMDLNNVPVYFVSSNSHSLINIIGGYFNHRQTFIFDFISHRYPDIYQQWFDSKRKDNPDNFNDFLYSFAGKFMAENNEFASEVNNFEKQLGVRYSGSPDLFPAKVQLIPLKSVAQTVSLDPNLKISDINKISQSPSYIINVQYPLGIAADYLLTEVLNYFSNLRSIHVQGKAAILNGNIGDIQIPISVLDETSGRTYDFDNIFNHYFPFSTHISKTILDQKAACVYGTFLENKPQMQRYVDSNINIIEMESGHYLHALDEYYKNNLINLPLELGIINYASDNPLVENLTKESLALRSIESTYLPSLTILQRIIDLELSS